MSSTMWTFALTVDGAFVPVPIARLRRFLDGEDTLPSVNDVVYVADVHVELEAREATRATIYGFFKYKVGRNGRWDPGHKHDADAAWADLMESIWSQPRADGVVGGDRFAKRRVDVHHRWQPTRDQLAQVSGAIIKRAKRAIVVGLYPNAPNQELS